LDFAGINAVVVALKIRNISASQARAKAFQALRFLKSIGCRKFYFKYCSTFDSTPRGNIGPIIDKLLEGLQQTFTVACTAFPDGGRTVYRGHLFVGETLLSESGMRTHPLTPMMDSNLQRVLSLQTRSKIGLIPFETVEKGPSEMRRAIRRLSRAGVRIAIVDAVSNKNLDTIGSATSNLKLVTGSSGLARGLRLLDSKSSEFRFSCVPQGLRAILAGSCSEATMAQVAHAKCAYPTTRLDPELLRRNPRRTVREILSWAQRRMARDSPVIIYSGGDATRIAREQVALGARRSGRQVERGLAQVAVGLVHLGVNQLILAGGDTSASIMDALGVTALRIGPQICPGVPWAKTVGTPHPLVVALKSGNFGSKEFMTEAWSRLDEN
jgi:uncharacterized protein YgbK (DUF1537 family)